MASIKRQWDHYFDHARSQYLWEIAINSRRFGASDDELAAPPRGQFILLHPNVAFEYLGSSAVHDQSYRAIPYLEIVGYNHLKYTNDPFLPMSDWPLGVSALVTYTPDNIGDRFGFGLMIHVKNDFSIGFARRQTGAGRDTTLLLSVDLMKAFLEKSQEVRTRFRFGN